MYTAGTIVCFKALKGPLLFVRKEFSENPNLQNKLALFKKFIDEIRTL